MWEFERARRVTTRGVDSDSEECNGGAAEVTAEPLIPGRNQRGARESNADANPDIMIEPASLSVDGTKSRMGSENGTALLADVRGQPEHWERKIDARRGSGGQAATSPASSPVAGSGPDGQLLVGVCMRVCVRARETEYIRIFRIYLCARSVNRSRARTLSLTHTYIHTRTHTHTQVRTSKPPRASESFRTDARKVHLCHHCSSATQVRKAKTEGSLGITIQGMGHSRYQCYCTHHDRADQYVHSV